MKEIIPQPQLESLKDSFPTTNARTDGNSASFGDMLARSLSEVNQLHLKADEAVQDLATGRQRDIHQTMIALEKAEIAFQFLMQIRNKIISAYETVMRMQV